MCLRKLFTPASEVRILLQLIELSAPGSLFVKKEWKDINAPFHGRVIFELGDASGFTVQHEAAAERDEQHTQMAPVQTLLGKVLGFVTVRWPIFHGIHKESRPAQTSNDVRTVLSQVLKRRRYKRFISHMALLKIIGMAVKHEGRQAISPSRTGEAVCQSSSASPLLLAGVPSLAPIHVD